MSGSDIFTWMQSLMAGFGFGKGLFNPAVAAFKLFLALLQRLGIGVELILLGGKSGYILFKVFLPDLTLTVVFVLVNVPCH